MGQLARGLPGDHVHGHRRTARLSTEEDAPHNGSRGGAAARPCGPGALRLHVLSGLDRSAGRHHRPRRRSDRRVRRHRRSRHAAARHAHDGRDARGRRGSSSSTPTNTRATASTAAPTQLIEDYLVNLAVPPELDRVLRPWRAVDSWRDPARTNRNRPDHVGRVRGSRLGRDAAGRPRARRDALVGHHRHRAGGSGLPAPRPRRARRGPRTQRHAPDRRLRPRRAPRPRAAQGDARRGPRDGRAVRRRRGDDVRHRGRRRPRLGAPLRALEPRSGTTSSACSASSTGCAPSTGSPRRCTRTSARSSRPPPTSATVLDRSDVRWCLDTGHLLIGGYDPAQFAADAGDRVVHVHLKDVRGDVAARVGAR